MYLNIALLINKTKKWKSHLIKRFKTKSIFYMINKDLNNLMNKKVNIKKKNGKIKIKINITPFIKKWAMHYSGILNKSTKNKLNKNLNNLMDKNSMKRKDRKIMNFTIKRVRYT